MAPNNLKNSLLFFPTYNDGEEEVQAPVFLDSDSSSDDDMEAVIDAIWAEIIEARPVPIQSIG